MCVCVYYRSAGDMSRYYVGVDVGTASVRAALVTWDGQVKHMAEEPVNIWEPCADHYEQSSEDIWSKCCRTVKVRSDDESSCCVIFFQSV